VNLPTLFAQAAPVVLTQEATFSWPIMVFLLGIAAAVGESRWRVARLEKDMESSEREVAEMKSEAATTKRDVAVMASSLARIEKGQEAIERMLREALSRTNS
jgi:hypothetical protein